MGREFVYFTPVTQRLEEFPLGGEFTAATLSAFSGKPSRWALLKNQQEPAFTGKSLLLPEPSGQNI